MSVTPFITASNIPVEASFPVVGSTMIKSGSLVYPVPPKVTSIALIVYEFIKETLGGTNASGLRVLSEEYSKPGSIILTLPILLIFLDTGKISAFIPCVDPILTKCGN